MFKSGKIALFRKKCFDSCQIIYENANFVKTNLIIAKQVKNGIFEFAWLNGISKNQRLILICLLNAVSGSLRNIYLYF